MRNVVYAFNLSRKWSGARELATKCFVWLVQLRPNAKMIDVRIGVRNLFKSSLLTFPSSVPSNRQFVSNKLKVRGSLRLIISHVLPYLQSKEKSKTTKLPSSAIRVTH